MKNPEVRNLEVAKELIKKYRSITKEDIAKVYTENPVTTLGKLTGFGKISTCALCKEGYKAENKCMHCLYYDGSACACAYQTTFQDIQNAESVEDLYDAIQARADFIEEFIRKYYDN